jgi:hypothetical protein
MNQYFKEDGSVAEVHEIPNQLGSGPQYSIVYKDASGNVVSTDDMGTRSLFHVESIAVGWAKGAAQVLHG